MKLTTLSPQNIFCSLLYCAMTPFALLRRKRKKVWIVTERPDQARDNGYCFFKYMKEQHPEQDVRYIIDTNAKDAAKVKPYGGIIRFGSIRHYWYFCLSGVHISAHTGGCVPPHSPIVRFLKPKLGYKDVFLPHGVSYGVSEFCLQKYTKINLFICSGKPEYDNVLKNYGYSEREVAYTGFPRLDGWHHITVNPKQIVLMPTWRLYLAQDPNTVFEETAYFKAYRDLVGNARLAEFLRENGLTLVFYLHNNMRKYVGSFHTDFPNIEIVDTDEAYDIQELLKSSALLITDYSSVHFDFSYMGKPVIYYQFDKEEFFTRQYGKADFDAEKDGFGPVSYTPDEVVRHLKESFENRFRTEQRYHDRMRSFYQLYDEHNCDRVYEAIMERICNSK